MLVCTTYCCSCALPTAARVLVATVTWRQFDIDDADINTEQLAKRRNSQLPPSHPPSRRTHIAVPRIIGRTPVQMPLPAVSLSISRASASMPPFLKRDRCLRASFTQDPSTALVSWKRN
ncbi:uncharacterized protein BDZ99DRAFT_297649 [Mytilinidion resinicola]|uniref:Uncharacterized protein n=1 Tax=Mytilinidion resinicola TaxID=574789 RepID=A0A6A6YQL3_9PEZI|nr:uncharacterized protein BDZ99DRAFT_297649 [Mytilinidion resinicola]KAF2811196.1 hypothetical protein BDZ99DRAFT_297649 [Mytilinidion resinicola]